MASFLQYDKEKKLIVIDHSPTDELRSICRVKDCEYEHHPENRGFGAGHNIAIRKMLDLSDYHLVLNPDVSFGNEVLPALQNYMDSHQQVAHMMPGIINSAGDVQHLAKLLPTPADLFFKRFLPASFNKRRKEKFQLLFTGYSQIMNVPYLSGCFMLLRTAALKEVGLFDERYFMYPEDIDLTRRLHTRYKTLYYPFVQVMHRHEASSYKSGKMLRIHLFNLIKYFNKWGWFFDRERAAINQKVLRELDYFRTLGQHPVS